MPWSVAERNDYKHEISLLHKKLTDIRQNHLHQTTSEIVKNKPFRIVMETLNIKGMMKNKHLSKAIATQKLFEFQRQITYKAQKFGIEVIKADKWFPSSKICSECGHKKVDLKLKDRNYHCINCQLKIDRDLNAALNLANYSI
ncbi:MAG: transposase [Streptococcaceae bacterium]|nr:transposase [Streptococcaceae bacterium]